MNIKNNTSLIINGTWNLGILVPEWFLDEFSWKSPPEQVPIELDLGSKNIRFTLDNILIQTSQNQIQLIAKNEDSTTYDAIGFLANNVYDKLPHTPIQAIGHNYSIVLEKNEIFERLNSQDIDQIQTDYKEVEASSTVNTIKIKHTVDYTDHSLNLEYTIGRSEKNLTFNFHYDVNLQKKIPGIINSFSENIKRAKEIANKIIVKEYK